jgi:carboxymethylenebutenolidase
MFLLTFWYFLITIAADISAFTHLISFRRTSPLIFRQHQRQAKGEKMMDHKIIDLHDDYLHGLLDRRTFMKKLAVLAGSAAAANAMLGLLRNNYAHAEMVARDDSRLDSESLQYQGATGTVRAAFSRPKGTSKLPGVVVIHENRGLNPHIEDVNRRVALEGFLSLAPDALSPLGGTPADSDKARDMIRTLDMKETLGNYLAAVQFLRIHPMSTGKVGVVGFCWGGGMANQLAVNDPQLTAAVPYYGRQAAAEDVPKIKASLLLHYAGLDQRINKGISAYETALKAAGIDYRVYVYDGANHAFNNDTNAARYNKDAAELAWKRTISFLTEKLKH